MGHHLVLGSGGIRGLSMLGALHYLYTTGKLTKINKFHGCSIGSVIGVLLIAGKRPMDIFNDLTAVDFNSYWDPDVANITKYNSLLTHKVFDFFKHILSKLVDNINITIKDFSTAFNAEVNILTTCLNSKSLTIMNQYNFPDVPITTAVIASCSIPFFYPPVEINNNFYVDGATKVFSGCLNETISKDTVVIKIGYNNENGPLFTDFKSYAYSIITAMATIEKEIENELSLTIKINEKFYNKHNFNDLSQSDMVEMFLYGLQQSEVFYRNKLLKKGHSPKDNDKKTKQDTNKTDSD